MCGSVTEERIEGTWGKVRARRAINGTFECYRKNRWWKGKGRGIRGYRSADEKVSVTACVREGYGRWVVDGTASRFRCGRDANDGRAQREGLGAGRRQDLHDQRALRELLRCDGGDG